MIFGAVIDESMGDEVRVTAIATGFGPTRRKRHKRERERLPEPAGVAASEEAFDIPDAVLDVPSFLRDS